MDTLLETTTKKILAHHLEAFMATDLDEIMKDYKPDSALMTPQGALQGLAAIRSFFEGILNKCPKIQRLR